MRLLLKPTEESKARLDHVILGLAERIPIMAGAVTYTAEDVFIEEVKETFAAEGLHGTNWDELAPFTQDEREELGFPREHPILVRTGLLRANLTTDAVVERDDPGTGNASLKIGTTDERFEELQMGRGGDENGRGALPPRPMVPDTKLDAWITCRKIEVPAVKFLDTMAKVVIENA